MAPKNRLPANAGPDVAFLGMLAQASLNDRADASVEDAEGVHNYVGPDPPSPSNILIEEVKDAEGCKIMLGLTHPHQATS